MTPKNRAKILIKEFSKADANEETVKKCAIIYANQMIRNYKKHPSFARIEMHWQQV